MNAIDPIELAKISAWPLCENMYVYYCQCMNTDSPHELPNWNELPAEEKRKFECAAKYVILVEGGYFGSPGPGPILDWCIQEQKVHDAGIGT